MCLVVLCLKGALQMCLVVDHFIRTFQTESVVYLTSKLTVGVVIFVVTNKYIFSVRQKLSAQLFAATSWPDWVVQLKLDLHLWINVKLYSDDNQ